MQTVARRLRGLLGLGLYSGIAWALLGVTMGTVVLLVDPAQVDVGEGPLWVAYYLGRTGFVAGVAAGALLAAVGRHKALRDLRMGTVATLGAAAGAALPWIAFAPRAMLPMLVVLSAGTAASALALARRGEQHVGGHALAPDGLEVEAAHDRRAPR